MTAPVIYNVVDYGADETGVSDSYTAIMDTIAAVPVGGGKIHFPNGTYLCSGTIDLEDLKNITFEGETVSRAYSDEQAATIQYTSSSGSLIEFNGAIGITFRGLNLSYTHASYASNFIVMAQGTGAADAKEVIFEDCSIMGDTGGSMDALCLIKAGDEMYDLLVQRCILSGARVGILGTSNTIIMANNVVIRDNLFLDPFTDVMIKVGGQQWVIERNDIEPATSGRKMASISLTSVGVYQLSVLNNLFVDGNHADSVCVDLSGGPVRVAYFAGNTFSDVHTGSIAITCGSNAVDGLTIVGNRLHCGTNLVIPNVVNPCILGNMYSYLITGIDALPTGTKGILQGMDDIRFHASPNHQAAAMISARNSSYSGNVPNSVEWGHANQSGYVNTLGFAESSGNGFLALSAEAGATSNTYKTRGRVGRILQYGSSGALDIGRATNSNADDQTLTSDVQISSTGQLIMKEAALVRKLVTLTYGTTVTPALKDGNVFLIDVTNGTAFTIANPSNENGDGADFTIIVKNSSGGAHGAITWGSRYKLAGGTSVTVATGKNQSITFVDAGGASSAYYEISRTNGDVAN